MVGKEDGERLMMLAETGSVGRKLAALDVDGLTVATSVCEPLGISFVACMPTVLSMSAVPVLLELRSYIDLMIKSSLTAKATLVPSKPHSKLPEGSARDNGDMKPHRICEWMS